MEFLNKSIVGIDFHDYSAQIVELKFHNGMISLEAYNRINIPPNIISNGDIVKEKELKIIIQKLFETANPKPIATKEVAIIFPAAKVFTHIFNLPANLSNDELKKALHFETQNVIPFALQDIYWDFTVIEENPSDNKKQTKNVLFAGIMKKIADKYISLLQSLQLTPYLFGINAEALKYGIIKQLTHQDSVLIIDINSLSINYLILKNNTIKHYFSANRGGKHLIASLSKEFQIKEVELIEQKEQNSFRKDYLPIIQKFIENNYNIAQGIMMETEKDENIGPIKEIYLTGEFLNLPDAYKIAQEKFPDKKISIGDPRKYLDINVTKFNPLKDDKGSKYYSTHFINAVGIGIRTLLADPREGINLLGDSLKENFGQKRKNFYFALASILICILCLFTASFIFFEHQTLGYNRSTLEVKKSNIDKIIYGTRYQEITDSIKNFNIELNELSQIDGKLFSLPITLQSIFELIPSEIKISEFSFDNKDLTIDISGVAQGRDVLLKTTQALKDFELIKEVITPISNYDQKYNISFSLTLILNTKFLPKYGSIIPS